MTTVTFAAQNTTWTAPAGVFTVQVECWGAGGAGFNQTGTTGGGGGGGGGAYSRTNALSVSPGTAYTVFAAPATTTSGQNGADSYFVNNTTCLAKGGLGSTSSGSGGTGGAGTGTSIGDVCFAGGNGAQGAVTGTKHGGGGVARQERQLMEPQARQEALPVRAERLLLAVAMAGQDQRQEAVQRERMAVRRVEAVEDQAQVATVKATEPTAK